MSKTSAPTQPRDQLSTVDLNRLTEPVGFLAIDEMRRVDEALALILDL